jgi:hypothetical protein
MFMLIMMGSVLTATSGSFPFSTEGHPGYLMCYE